MKKQGFSYIGTIIAVMLVSIIATSVTHIASLAARNKQQLAAHSILTHSMVNITEALTNEVAQGNDISDYTAATDLALYDRIDGDVVIHKEYILSGAAVYIVNFSLNYKKTRLGECVVIYGNE